MWQSLFVPNQLMEMGLYFQNIKCAGTIPLTRFCMHAVMHGKVAVRIGEIIELGKTLAGGIRTDVIR